MAELNTGDDGGKKGSKKIRSKKQNSKVDLTAMVDLAFLLITFFMLTTSLSKPQTMNLGLPDSKDTTKADPKLKVDEKRTLTIILGKDNKLKWFKGLPDNPIIAPKSDTYGKEGIRKALLTQVKEVSEYCASIGKPKDGLIVLIKPTKLSTYRNLVDVLDEMAICNVPTYAIVPEFNTVQEKAIADELNK
jgi:biopolymer transport protein ExbD